MAEVRPFRGLRYRDAGPIEELVAPPYDVLTSAERDALAEKSSHNIVHLTLPLAQPDDRSKYVKYARSSAGLAEWRRSGYLALEDRPVFYRNVQTFGIPGTPERFRRTALITLIKVEPYEKGVVLPHEQTFPKHKEDRLRLLEATRTHLECIYGLFEDPDGGVFRCIDGAPSAALHDFATEDGVRHELFAVESADACAAIQQGIADKKVWIADGHHRYETACNFRAALGERDGAVPEDFMMMALSSMSDPGLVLLPTHRILQKGAVSVEDIVTRLEVDFERRDVANATLWDEVAQRDGAPGVFGVALPGGKGALLTARDFPSIVASVEGGSELLRGLDVSILHRVVLERRLGIAGLDGIAYTRDPAEAIRSVDDGASAAFLMNPPTVDQMRRIALGGEKMPQKSTYYYPKLLSGLVVWSLNDFEA
ncbi:MAG: DUF1015 domain-containing protein [Fimbriimonadaceae bacterium]|nr:DUF1015 domain-containing protein [Fimbriimonadaceae bacterium]